MGRAAINPADYGIPLSSQAYKDQMIEELNIQFYGQMTIDELLLHPREAILFCDRVRAKFKYFLVPDDVLLRPMMLLRKASKKPRKRKSA